MNPETNPYNFKKLTDFNEAGQKKLRNILNMRNVREDETVYVKVAREVIEYRDDNDIPFWHATIELCAYVIIDKEGRVRDKFVTPAFPFRIRNQTEQHVMNMLIDQLSDELDFFEQKGEQQDEQEEIEEIAYES